VDSADNAEAFPISSPTNTNTACAESSLSVAPSPTKPSLENETGSRGTRSMVFGSQLFLTTHYAFHVGFIPAIASYNKYSQSVSQLASQWRANVCYSFFFFFFIL
jgi:hypothetical protein